MNHRMDNFHRHMGVYGICVQEERLLVIEKILGPYSGQYDLPGGRLEPYESLEQAVLREFNEETGYSVTHLTGIGVCDFQVLWTRKDNTTEHLHHIAMMYEIKANFEQSPHAVATFEGQDSKRAIWVPLQEITADNASPLVLQAVQWIKYGTIPVACTFYDYRK